MVVPRQKDLLTGSWQISVPIEWKPDRIVVNIDLAKKSLVPKPEKQS
jgi:hypothetical protein